MPGAKLTTRARAAFGRLLRGEGMPPPTWARYGLAIVLCGCALAARFAMLPVNAGLAFLTFYPVVIVSALILGTGPAVLVIALGAASADYFFLRPNPAFQYGIREALSVATFAFTGSLTCFLAHHVRRAAREQREGQQRLRGLYEAPHVGIVLTDMSGRYLQFNDAFRNICGYSADELLALDYWALTPQKYAAAEIVQLDSVKRTGHYGPYEKEYVRKDGSLIPLQLNGALLKGSDGQTYIWSIIEDITERKKLEARVAAESARNRLFLHTASDGVHILDADGIVVEASDSFCAMLGYARAEVIGMHPTQWDAHLAVTGGRARSSELIAGIRTRFTTVHRRKDGSTFDAEVTVDRFDLDGESYVYCSARDITERRRLERAVLAAADGEQRRLGHDLHDGLGQELTGLALLASALASSERKAGRPAADGIAQLEALARRAIVTCRAVARGLSPLGYTGGGLVEALEELVNLQRETFGADVRFEAIRDAPLRLSTDTSDHLYRIAQEAVTNARRHGQAPAIDVIVDIGPKTVRLEILDNGTGLAGGVADSSGMGLRIMHYRAGMIGARLSVGSGNHGGTLVACECPQPQEAVAATEPGQIVARR
jgi:two-component system, LuxR family, sensor kinase FixL